MLEGFRNNIKSLLNINDSQFDSFHTCWKNHLENNIGKNRLPLICSEKYMEALLSLFFVYRQIDCGTRTKIVDDKSVFLTVISFYIAEDVKLTVQTDSSVAKLWMFLDELFDKGLIKQTTLRNTKAYLNAINSPMTFSDSVNVVDIKAIEDLIVSTNPVTVRNKALMFYYGEPMKTYFKYSKEEAPTFTPEQFFDASFKISQTIHDTFLRELYIANLHHLMETQANKNIFPF